MTAITSVGLRVEAPGSYPGFMTAEPDETARRSDYPTTQTLTDLVHALDVVRERVADAAQRSGRRADEVRLLPVSKTVSEQRIRSAVEAGCTEFGENKVQEAARKHDELSDLDIGWSVIGHLQSNKAKDVAAFASEFQALDRLKLAKVLDRRLQALGRGLDVFVQVNTSGEDSKYGLPPEDALAFLRELPTFTSLRVQGLMTLAVFTDDTEQVRACFRRLREVRDRAREQDPDLIGIGGLSMGMSGDYETAIEEGATVVRVGQAIFGARALPDSHYWPTGSS